MLEHDMSVTHVGNSLILLRYPHAASLILHMFD